MSDPVLVEKGDGLAVVTLNRPERMNSLTTALMSSLAERLRELAADPEVRVVMLTGAGDRAFSAGADLAPPDAPAPSERQEWALKSASNPSENRCRRACVRTWGCPAAGSGGSISYSRTTRSGSGYGIGASQTPQATANVMVAAARPRPSVPATPTA